MSVYLYTNRGKSIKRPYNPIEKVSGEKIVVFATAANDVALIPGDTFWRRGFEFGPSFQATCNVTVSLTLGSRTFALNPSTENKVVWDVWKAIVAGDIEGDCPKFTAAKVLFSAAGELTVLSM